MAEIGSSPWPVGTLLSRLEARTAEVLLGLGTNRQVCDGGVLLREGDETDHVVLLKRAIVKVTVNAPSGREALLSIRVTGDLVGETSALNRRRRSATVTASGRALVSVIHRREFQPFLRDHPDAAVQVAGVVADRLRWANRMRVEFSDYPIKVRLARILAELASAYGRRTSLGLEIAVPLTHHELATLTGGAEVTVQKALRELREEGLILGGYRRTTVLDLPTLCHHAHLPTRDL